MPHPFSLKSSYSSGEDTAISPKTAYRILLASNRATRQPDLRSIATLRDKLAKMKGCVAHHKTLVRKRMHAAKSVQNEDQVERFVEEPRQFNKQKFDECCRCRNSTLACYDVSTLRSLLFQSSQFSGGVASMPRQPREGEPFYCDSQASNPNACFRDQVDEAKERARKGGSNTSQVTSLLHSIAGKTDSSAPEPQHRNGMDRPKRKPSKQQCYTEEASKDRG
ncbi:uncharacterized protein BDZ99DRAFT_514102 [Mytilinidion resinicola]|uniref:Uncharacterized protein n=1 Tax=Mytilinidion resinicola TaxID=574789 RepID=A0A6A6Z9S5_9PEZI|nr:uncharacterized protein BDZ99DRAFT_514102 [Mytilinidion resinicola]KAF2817882.1 hypothetical protein BDZ99DRAFT_514102 [Mytilinidion resinicola]